jgi:hypothetical protein
MCIYSANVVAIYNTLLKVFRYMCMLTDLHVCMYVYFYIYVHIYKYIIKHIYINAYDYGTYYCMIITIFKYSYISLLHRARKPKSPEKEALDIAFLLSPVVSLIMPSLTKDTAIIWWANAVAVAGCYAYAYLKPKEEGEDKSLVPEFISKGNILNKYIMHIYISTYLCNI